MRVPHILAEAASVAITAIAIAADQSAAAERCLVKPLLDVPLRAPSICKGPDGTYNLTGTTAVEALCTMLRASGRRVAGRRRGGESTGRD